MPYEIRKNKNKWCVYKKGGEKPFGCHDTHEKAKAQLRALYASENRNDISANHLKAISQTDTEYRAGNYIILFGGRDLEFVKSGRNQDGSLGTCFVPETRIESEFTKKGQLPVDFEHGDDDIVGDQTLGYVDWSTAKKDEKGWFVERVLDRRNKYIQFLEELIDAGLIGNSSEAVPDGVKTLEDGTIISWPLMRDTITVSPVEPRMLGENVLSALKGLSNVFPSAEKLIEQINKSGGNSGTGKGMHEKDAYAGDRKSTGTNKSKKREVKSMDILEAIKKLVPGLSAEQYEQIGAILGLSGMAVSSSEEPVVDEAGEEMKSIPLSKLVSELKSLGYTVVLPGQKPEQRKAISRPPFEKDPEINPEDAAKQQAAKAIDAAHMLRFEKETDAQKAILTDVIGTDYRQQIYDQNIAFARYLRGGERVLSAQEQKSLKTMIFPIDQIVSLIKDGGYDTRTIKATQVEAIGELGGWAVPPNIESEVSRRLPGLTAVRGGGARIVQLINSNSVEIPQYRSTDTTNRYIGEIRGQWGTEIQAPTEQNFKMDMVPVFAHVYTYKIPFSRSLVEDATNLVSIVQEDISITAAIDEDEADLVGDGVGKPLGILPGGANSHGFTEVESGDDATITPDGVKALKRALPTQYRGSAVWVANSDTYGVIERLQYTVDGHYVFEDLSETELLLKRRALESGAMPDIAANSYPLIFSDMAGYTIVERLGMTIERFMDSYTGPNKIEFHVRRRIGGCPEKTWLFKVMKIADTAESV